MTDASTRDDVTPGSAAPTLDDAVDEVLVGLPAPPRTRVRLLGALLVAISAVSLFLAWQLRDDVQYAFASSTAIDLGDGRLADVTDVRPNQLVHLRAAPEIGAAVRYTRPLFPGEYVVFPIAGRVGRSLYVQADGSAPEAGEFTGRLIPFGGAGGRYAQVARYLHREFGAPVDGSTYLVVDGATPRGSVWAVIVAALLLALALGDLGLLFRLLRPAERSR